MRLNGKTLILLMLLAIRVLFTDADSARADSGIDDLTPNTYEKKDFKGNTDYLHDKSLYENRENGSSKEVQDLTFKKNNSNPLEKVKAQLFTDTNKETNTIASKALLLNLFTDDNVKSYDHEDTMEQTAKQKSRILILYIGLLIIGLLILLVILIPKMVHSRTVQE